MDKTIKQIADELGISKQAVRQRINKLSSDCYYVGSNKTIYVNEKGYKILTEKASSGANKNTTNIDTSIEALIKQLDIKDKQIEELTKSLQFEQGKTRELTDRLLLLEDKQIEIKHKSLFNKLFKRKE